MPLQGVTGGVTSFPEFEAKFFPEVAGQQGDAQGVTYCQYNNQPLQLFTSSLYLAGIFSTLVGGYTSRCLWIMLLRLYPAQQALSQIRLISCVGV